MNFKLTVSLLIVVILLFSVYFLLKDKKPAEKTAESATTPLITPMPVIKTFSYVRDGQQQVAFSRGESDTWKMTFPVESAVDFNVRTIAETLQSMGYKEKFEPEASGSRSAEATGTQSPHNVISFTDDKGAQHSLNLGKRTVGGIFATLDSSKTIYLLGHNPLDQVDKDPQDFRSKIISTVQQDKITALTVKRGNESVSLARTGDAAGDHNWLLTAPISARANHLVVDDMLNEMRSINAQGFSDMAKNMPAVGLNPPRLTVTAYVNDAKTPTTATSQPSTQPAGKPVTLEIGLYTGLTDKKSVYASLAGSSQVFTMNAETFTKLNRELKDLRDPAITPAAVGEATEMTVTSAGNPPIKGVKNAGKWTVSSGTVSVPGGELELGDILGDIRNMRAIKFSDNAGNLKAIGLDPPETRIELTVPHQSQHEVILVGKTETDPNGGKVTPVMRQGEPTVYQVPATDVEKIHPTLLNLRDKKIERLTERVKSISIAGPGAGTAAATLEREGTSWKATVAGKNVPADEEKITTLLTDFTPLTAAKFLSQDANVSGNPDVVVTVTLLEPTTTTAPATTSAPASIGPAPTTEVTRTLKLFKTTQGTQTTWKALWSGPGLQWTFEPTPELIGNVTKESYAAATQPAKLPPMEMK